MRERWNNLLSLRRWDSKSSSTLAVSTASTPNPRYEIPLIWVSTHKISLESYITTLDYIHPPPDAETSALAQTKTSRSRHSLFLTLSRTSMRTEMWPVWVCSLICVILVSKILMISSKHGIKYWYRSVIWCFFSHYYLFVFGYLFPASFCLLF